MKLYFDVKNLVHDASGIVNPNKYYWEMINNIYYPKREMTIDELHEEIRNFLDNENLPQDSLDEIDLDIFNSHQMEKRNFFLNLFHNC